MYIWIKLYYNFRYIGPLPNEDIHKWIFADAAKTKYKVLSLIYAVLIEDASRNAMGGRLSFIMPLEFTMLCRIKETIMQ